MVKAKASAAAFAVSGTGTTMESGPPSSSSSSASRVPDGVRVMYTLDPSSVLATFEKYTHSKKHSACFRSLAKRSNRSLPLSTMAI